MKKHIKIISFISMFVFLFSATALAVTPIKIFVSNKQLPLDTSPVLKEGRTLVPLRAIFESLDANVEWNPQNQTVVGKTSNKEIKLTINNKVAYINNAPLGLDVPACIINGRTMVPTRFVAESLGAQVDWHNASRSVLINSDKNLVEKQINKYGSYKVVRVVDGDTIIVNYNGKDERVRLIGVDTPESVHPDKSKNSTEGITASNFTKSKLEGQAIGLEFDVQKRDRYGRLLAYVWLGNEMFNKTLLTEGYAKIATYPPNVKYVDDFKALQEQARNQNKSLWSNELSVPVISAPTTPESNNNANVAKTGTYIGSLKSDKFHYPTCRWAKKITSKNEVWFKDKADAQAHGYQSCGSCNP